MLLFLLSQEYVDSTDVVVLRVLFVHGRTDNDIGGTVVVQIDCDYRRAEITSDLYESFINR